MMAGSETGIAKRLCGCLFSAAPARRRPGSPAHAV